ncbi:NrfD/PsrC family molybdoenzyme membrane anchor subunit [Desulfobulbus sp.]|uniref:NrfD/PsrC family molybdoenzyme membrane anchor subunit n=1 Tax=Desulfobulbus sp. TaxID=895 RepID=UPI00286F744F|nr:NrfD/PsrC family molybdoenzyme membrane anchor subunit [Desulfobulbus sp.]
MNIYTKTTNLPLPSMNQILVFIVLALACGIGLAFGLHTMIVGHHHTFGTTREVPWGLLVTPYVFFACLATGLCIVSALGQVFNLAPFKPLVTRTVFLAIVAMAAGLMCITLELENPWRVVFYAWFSPQPFSNIWWKTAIYSCSLVMMICNFMLLLIKRPKIAKGFALVAFVLLTAGNLNMNSDMGLLGERGFWSDNYMPIYFLSLSIMTGCAAILLLNWLAYKFNGESSDAEHDRAFNATSKLFFFMLLGLAYFSVVKIMGGYFPRFAKNPEAMALLVKGDFARNFWLGEICLAILLPLALYFLAQGKKLAVMALAGISCLIGVFVLYYDLVIVGQLVPHFQHYNVVDLPQYYAYTPTLHEIMISAGSVFFFLTAFIFGEMLFKKVYSN